MFKRLKTKIFLFALPILLFGIGCILLFFYPTYYLHVLGGFPLIFAIAISIAFVILYEKINTIFNDLYKI